MLNNSNNTQKDLTMLELLSILSSSIQVINFLENQEHREENNARLIHNDSHLEAILFTLQEICKRQDVIIEKLSKGKEDE